MIKVFGNASLEAQAFTVRRLPRTLGSEASVPKHLYFYLEIDIVVHFGEKSRKILEELDFR